MSDRLSFLDEIDDPGLAERLAALRSGLVASPAPETRAAHVSAALAALGDAASPAPRSCRGALRARRLLRGAVAVATFVAMTGGAAYAGVLPEPIQDRVAAVASAVGIALPRPAWVAERPTTAASPSVVPPTPPAPPAVPLPVGGRVGEAVREASAGVRDAAHDLGDGARAWAGCVRDVAVRGGAVDPLEECGTPPDPAEYGLPPSAEEIEQIVQDIAAATGADADALRAWVACLRDGLPSESGDPIRLDPGRCGPPPIPTPVGVTVPSPGEPPAAPPIPDDSSLAPPTGPPVATPPPVTVTVPPGATEDLVRQVEELAGKARDGFLPPPRFDR